MERESGGAAAWIEEATTSKIEPVPDAPAAKKDSSDLMQGYCYQMWRCRHNCYRADGAFGQFIIIMPDQDAIVVFTAESPDMWGELDMVWKYLYPGIKDGNLCRRTRSLFRNLKADWHPLLYPSRQKAVMKL